MTAKRTIETLKWVTSTFGVSIVGLIIWGATLTADVRQMRRELDDIWDKYNKRIEDRELGMERLIKTEGCCDELKERIENIERSQIWRKNEIK